MRGENILESLEYPVVFDGFLYQMARRERERGRERERRRKNM